MICSFLGHGDSPESIYLKLYSEIENLIISRSVTGFLVGNHGSFDRMVLKALRELKERYPQISYHVVLAYMPGTENSLYHYTETILPEGIETVPKRFAISRRNRWMVQQCQIVICYITHQWGGAAQFVNYAKKQLKEIINLAE